MIFSFKIAITKLLLAICLLCGRSGENAPLNLADAIVLVGSTPGDESIKSLLAIREDKKVDFIRWNVLLTNRSPDQGTFVLHITFGESQPNTLGFKGGGEKLSFEGEYSISQERHRPVYYLKSNNFPSGLSIIKLSDNVFHLLSGKNELLVGNGGWSYTLNRAHPVQESNVALVSFINSADLKGVKEVVYDGRTPCLQFAKDNNLTVPQDCIKLKWRLILYRDPVSLLPTTYLIKRIGRRENILQGTWSIEKEHSSGLNTFIIRLDPDKPDQSISLLVGDENVLFFLNKKKELYIGNSDFSFTLNKKNE
jgi:hypothetical protein